ncbi:MAG: hypothetical protein AB1646_14250 [Thermodesulfobacteriota bacterium]
MRRRLQVTALVLLSVLLLPLVGWAQNYLIIRNRDGTIQRIPLQHDPEQIESFRMEAGPKVEAPPAGKEPAVVPARPPERAPEQPSERPPLGMPRVGPRQPPPLPGPSLEPPATRKPEPPTKAEIKAVEPPSVAKMDGRFVVNVYKLPKNVKTLPDFATMRPVQMITAPRIDLNPATGSNEPADLPQDDEGLGLRFQGMFYVSGEGIFKWRLHSKDGARMHIDDKTLIENDGIHGPSSKTGFVHLAEGAHTIIVDSFNVKGSPVLQLFVTPPVGPEQVFSPVTGVAGWKEPRKLFDVLWGQVYFVPKGDYPKGPEFSKLNPIGRVIAPELNIGGGADIPGLPGKKDMVGIRYDGFFNVEGAGIFSFRLAADHYAKLSIGKYTIVETTGKDSNGAVGWAWLEQGGQGKGYPIVIDYFHPSGTPRLELYVAQPEKPETLFSPGRALAGYNWEQESGGNLRGYVYFVRPGTKTFPNLNEMKAAGMFQTSAIDYPIDRPEGSEFPGIPKRDSWFAVRFPIAITLSDAEKGNYKFRMVAKSGARFIVDDKRLINMDRVSDEVREESGTVVLNKGKHTFFLDFFATTGPNALQLYITPPGGEEKIFAFQ